MSKFSIVVPVYKTEKYLDCCVESVLCQTFADFELILVDDGSPDNCPAICDAWAEKDARIKVVHQKNGGLSAARNAGIRNAAGTYVMFLDSDDWWADASVLERVSLVLEETGAEVLSFNYRKEYNGRLDPLYFSESLPDSQKSETIGQMTANGSWVTGACNKAVLRSLMVEHDLYFKTGITSEDIDWTLRLALAGERFAYANICVFIYRQHGASITNSPTTTKVECLCGNVQECVRLLERAERGKAEMLRPFVAYQYGTLLHNVANLPGAEQNERLMGAVKEMSWLLGCSGSRKIRLLRVSSKFLGMSATLSLLRLRQKLLTKCGRGV